MTDYRYFTNDSIKASTGLVAAYNFKPSGSTLVDISGEGNDGTISGALSTKDGMAFDGVDDYVTIANADNLNMSSITIVSKININNISGERVIIEKSYSYGWELMINNGQIKVDARINGIYLSGLHLVSTISINQYNNILWTYDKATNKSKIYLNGVLQEIITLAAGDGSGLETNALRMYIGSRNGSGLFFDGEIADLKIYNYAFTPQQAKDYSNSFIKPVLRDSFKDSGADGIVKTPQGWIE